MQGNAFLPKFKKKKSIGTIQIRQMGERKHLHSAPPILEKLLIFIAAPLSKSLLHYVVLIGRWPTNAFISLAAAMNQCRCSDRRRPAANGAGHTFLIGCVRRIETKRRRRRAGWEIKGLFLFFVFFYCHLSGRF